MLMTLKKIARFAVVLLVLSASSSIVLHSGHMDDAHLKSAAPHHCLLCKTVGNTPSPAAGLQIPQLVVSDAAPLFHPTGFLPSRVSDQDPRGPPLSSAHSPL